MSNLKQKTVTVIGWDNTTHSNGRKPFRQPEKPRGQQVAHPTAFLYYFQAAFLFFRLCWAEFVGRFFLYCF